VETEDLDELERICDPCRDGIHQACIARLWTGDPDYLDSRAPELVDICLCPECYGET